MDEVEGVLRRVLATDQHVLPPDAALPPQALDAPQQVVQTSPLHAWLRDNLKARFLSRLYGDRLSSAGAIQARTGPPSDNPSREVELEQSAHGLAGAAPEATSRAPLGGGPDPGWGPGR